MDNAEAAPFNTAVTLQSLPAEIITSIADHLRSLPHDREDYTPRLPSACNCSQVTPLQFAKAQVQSLGYYQDEALAFGMTCRRLREIVFVERLQRMVGISLCRRASTKTCRMPQRLRDHVRYAFHTVRCRAFIQDICRTLHMKSNSDHAHQWIDLNYLLDYLPNVDKLIVHWRLFLHETEDRLLEPQEDFPETEIRELELFIGNKSTGIVDSGEDSEEMLPAIVKETEDLLAHIHLPVLESLFLRMDINEPLVDDDGDWDELAEGIKLGRWEKTLKRVDVVISFDLGDEPDMEVSDVSRFSMGNSRAKSHDADHAFDSSKRALPCSITGFPRSYAKEQRTSA